MALTAMETSAAMTSSDITTDHPAFQLIPSPLRSTRSIHDLPTELLERILQLSVPPHAPRPYLIRHSVKLRRVCKHWQRIIDGCPTLWSEVTFEGGLDLLSQCLTNSKDAALTIKCNLGLGSGWRETKMMNMVLAHAKRWKSLDMTIWSKTHRDVEKYLPISEGEGGAPMCTEVKMYCTQIWPESAAGLSSATKFPRLKSLQLVDVVLSDGFGTFPELEELSLIDVREPDTSTISAGAPRLLSIQTLRGVLLACSGTLRTLKLHGELSHTETGNWRRTPLEEREPISFPVLQKLGVFRCNGETAFRVLRIVDAPGCVVLKVFAEELLCNSSVVGDVQSPEFPSWMIGRSRLDGDDEETEVSSAGWVWTDTVTHVVRKLDPESTVLEFEVQEKGFSVRSASTSWGASEQPSLEVVVRPPRSSENSDNNNGNGNDNNTETQTHVQPLDDPSTSSFGSSPSRRNRHRDNPLFMVLKYLVVQASRTTGDGHERGLLCVPARLKFKDGKKPSWGRDFNAVLDGVAPGFSTAIVDEVK